MNTLITLFRGWLADAATTISYHGHTAVELAAFERRLPPITAAAMTTATGYGYPCDDRR